MRIFFLTVMLCMISFFPHAQNIRYPVTAAYTQLQAYNASDQDPFSFITNQASLASVKKLSAGMYGEKRFLLSELAYYSAAFCLPVATGGFGFNANYFGNADYNESSLSIAYGRKMNDKMDIGLQFNYYNIKANPYGNVSAVNFDFAAIYSVTDKLRAGFHFYNPTQSEIGKSQSERLPFIYSLGAGYDPTKNIYIGCEIQKAEMQSADFKMGVRYRFSKDLFTRFGIATLTSSYYFGLGFLSHEMRLDAIASVHPYLGITPGILLVFNGL